MNVCEKKEVIYLRFYGLTDRGKQRENNEDCIYVCNVTDELKLFIVADGMGRSKCWRSCK